jgi:hypothetical protein
MPARDLDRENDHACPDRYPLLQPLSTSAASAHVPEFCAKEPEFIAQTIDVAKSFRNWLSRKTAQNCKNRVRTAKIATKHGLDRRA